MLTLSINNTKSYAQHPSSALKSHSQSREIMHTSDLEWVEKSEWWLTAWKTVRGKTIKVRFLRKLSPICCRFFIFIRIYGISKDFCYSALFQVPSCLCINVWASWLIVAESSRLHRCQMSYSIRWRGSCLRLFIYDLPGFPAAWWNN